MKGFYSTDHDVLCEIDDVTKNVQLQDVLFGFAQVTCLTAGPILKDGKKEEKKGHRELKKE